MQGLVKFDPTLVNLKESSVAPEVSADVEQAASGDLRHLESSSAPPIQPGQKPQQSHHQPPARSKQETDKRPKKRAKKSEDVQQNANWDSDQSFQVSVTLQQSYSLPIWFIRRQDASIRKTPVNMTLHTIPCCHFCSIDLDYAESFMPADHSSCIPCADGV